MSLSLDALRASDENMLDEAPALVADYLEFCLFSGLRRDDVLSLRWDQIEFDTALMNPVIHKRKKMIVTLPLSDYLLTILRRRQQIRVNEYVFAGRGGIGRFDEPKRQIAKVVEASGIAFSSHNLRQTYVTTANNLRLTPYTIKHLVAHSVGSDVTGGYVIVAIDDLRDAMQRITDYLLKAMGKMPGAEIIPLLKQR